MPTISTYPDHTLENAVRATGARCIALWEERGPKNTNIAWMVCYAINGRAVIVQTYKTGGWDAFTHSASNRVDDTIIDVLNRCDVSAPAKSEAA